MLPLSWKDPLTSVPPSRHPFQIWVMVALILAGLGNLLGAGSSNSVATLLPDLFVKVWSGTMLGGGILCLAGAWWPDRITGLLLERISLTAVALVLFVYAIAVFYVAGNQALVAGIMTVAMSGASAWRCLHISQELENLRKFIEWHYDES